MSFLGRIWRSTFGTRRVMAEFASADAMLAALDALRGGRYHAIETYTPFDMPEVDARLDRPRSRIGWVGLAGGLVGLALGYGVQWWANVHRYPMNAGGRPAHAAPAFIPATFDATVLCAALALFVGVLLRLRLPRLWDPVDEVDGFTSVTCDRFWIVVDAIVSDHDGENAERLLRDAGARRTVTVTAR